MGAESRINYWVFGRILRSKLIRLYFQSDFLFRVNFLYSAKRVMLVMF